MMQFVLVSLFLFSAGCSDRRSSAVISFEKAIAEGSAFAKETKISKFGCDDEVVETLDGKKPIINPKRSYNIFYDNPTMIASVQCMANGDDAKKEFEDAVEKLSSNHPLKLDAHEDLDMGVPAIGFWTDEDESQKQVIFLYGNLVVVVQTFFSSSVPLKEVRKFAEDYVAYLDTVTK